MLLHTRLLIVFPIYILMDSQGKTTLLNIIVIFNFEARGFVLFCSKLLHTIVLAEFSCCLSKGPYTKDNKSSNNFDVFEVPSTNIASFYSETTPNEITTGPNNPTNILGLQGILV